MKNNHSFFLLISALFLFPSCSEEEVETHYSISDLPTKPESLNAYMNITIGDTTYHREDAIDGFVLYGDLLAPAEGSESQVEIGSSISNDSSEVDFSIRYTHDKQSRDELLGWLIREKQDVAHGYFDAGIYQPDSYGFLFELSENNLVNGGGIAYVSNSITQPLSSYFHIEEYYAGQGYDQTINSIWLQGEFNVLINGKMGLREVSGNFLLEFSVCCFE